MSGCGFVGGGASKFGQYVAPNGETAYNSDRSRCSTLRPGPRGPAAVEREQVGAADDVRRSGDLDERRDREPGSQQVVTSESESDHGFRLRRIFRCSGAPV